MFSAMLQVCIAWLVFFCYFNGLHGGVLCHGFEVQIDAALGVGYDAVEDLLDGGVFLGGFQYVEVMQ